LRKLCSNVKGSSFFWLTVYIVDSCEWRWQAHKQSYHRYYHGLEEVIDAVIPEFENVSVTLMCSTRHSTGCSLSSRQQLGDIEICRIRLQHRSNTASDLRPVGVDDDDVMNHYAAHCNTITCRLSLCQKTQWRHGTSTDQRQPKATVLQSKFLNLTYLVTLILSVSF